MFNKTTPTNFIAPRYNGIADEWYRFRDAVFEEIAIEFLEAHGIAYQREPPHVT